MGTAPSKDLEPSAVDDHGGFSDGGGSVSGVFASAGGAQLYVSLKMECSKLKGHLIPHVFGSAPIVGSWDSSKALSMERESASMWELSFVVPRNHETLDFKFLLKPKDENMPCVVEEGPNRVLTKGSMQGNTTQALFNWNSDEVMECPVLIKADRVSPFDLGASWRAYRENLQPSTVRGIPDISINELPQNGFENESSATLDLDIEHYVIPSPASPANSVYAANLAASPRDTTFISNIQSTTSSSSSSSETNDQPTSTKETYLSVLDLSNEYPHSGLVESKSVGTLPNFQKQESSKGLLVDRGVGSSRLVKSLSSSIIATDLKLDSESKNAIPAAAGAVAAAAVADQMLGPKEDGHLAIVLVGLPARGKTFTAAKLTRYLRWLGHDTKHFNVGKYRRLKCGTNQSAEFFRADNPEGIEARNEMLANALYVRRTLVGRAFVSLSAVLLTERCGWTNVAALAMEDMISWMHEGGQVGVFDATNSSRVRRNMLMKMAEGNCKIIFLETICNDDNIIERNIRLKVQQSPDYAEQPDFDAGCKDFRDRLSYYEKVYEPVEEGSYIKMIDMASGHGGQIQVNNISGYLPGRIVFFLVNTHLTPHPIFLTRHGESLFNVRGRIGGDSVISDAGELYAKKLANFVEKRLKSERAASVWTSTLQRSILTARHIGGFPKIQWRSLDEINAGVCDGMTYEEIKKNMPDEHESRENDKLRYRYPRGESYLDVIQRLEPVIIELERQRAPVVVVSHQAVLRSLYAYFADKPLHEIPHIEIPLHTIIEIQMGVSGLQEKRYKLMDSECDAA